MTKFSRDTTMLSYHLRCYKYALAENWDDSRNQDDLGHQHLELLAEKRPFHEATENDARPVQVRLGSSPQFHRPLSALVPVLANETFHVFLLPLRA